jgi:hypothetical protein
MSYMTTSTIDPLQQIATETRRLRRLVTFAIAGVVLVAVVTAVAFGVHRHHQHKQQLRAAAEACAGKAQTNPDIAADPRLLLRTLNACAASAGLPIVKPPR